MSGRNENLAANPVAGFGGAGECDFRGNWGCLGRDVSLPDEVFFDPTLEGGGGLAGAADGSDNKGSRPTGTRFKSCVRR